MAAHLRTEMAFIGQPLILTNRIPHARALSPRHSNSTHRRCFPRAAAKAQDITADELEAKLLANERPLLVDAYAPWCGPCQFLLPQLDIVARKYDDRLDILKFNTEKYPGLASALMIRGLPTLFFIRDAKLRYRMEGALTAEELDQLVDYILFDGPAPTRDDLTPNKTKADE